MFSVSEERKKKTLLFLYFIVVYGISCTNRICQLASLSNFLSLQLSPFTLPAANLSVFFLSITSNKSFVTRGTAAFKK